MPSLGQLDPERNADLLGLGARRTSMSTASHARIGIALAALAVACGQEDPPPRTYETFEEACAAVEGCGETRFPVPGATERIFRVEVVRAPDGEVRIESIDAVDVAEGIGVPVGPPRGTHVLAARDASGAPLDGQMLVFPETLYVESFGEAFLHEEVSLADREVDRIAYVRALPDAVDVAVLAIDGAVLATATLPDDDTGEPGRASAPLIAASSACAHVRLIDGEADRAHARNVAFEDTIALVSPGPMQRATIDAALGRMPPLLCHAISRVAFARVPDMPNLRGAVMAAGGGDMILLNVAHEDANFGGLPFTEAGLGDPGARAALTRAFVHEAGHAVAALLEAQGERPGAAAGDWVPAGRALAEQTIAHVRVEGGFGVEWQRMHDSFVEEEWAQPYAFEEQRRMWGPDQTVRAGAMTPYGSTSLGDDICEMIAWPTTAELFRQAGVPEGRYLLEDAACQAMRAYNEGDLPARFAAAYTKLRFLEDLGLLAREDVEACIGTGITLPTPAVGMQIWEGGELRRTYTRDPDGGLYTVADADTPPRYVFQLEAGGELEFGETTHAATAAVTVDLGGPPTPMEWTSWPRGIYPITRLSPHTFTIDVPDEPAANFSAYDGYILVARASGSGVVGSVVVYRVMRWNAPVPVPELFDPPLVIRFRYE